MNVKGLDTLRAQVPEVATRWGLLRVGMAILAVLAATTLFLLAADRWFAEWMPDGELVVLALGFLLISRFFSQRERYQQKYGDRAYQVAFARYNIWGLGIIGAAIAHLAYIAGPAIPAVWWRPWLQMLGYACLAAGLLLWVRAITSLGIDNLVMLYVYRPQRAPRPEAGLYRLLRHPMYAGAIDVGFGLALIHANWYALLVALLLPLFFFGWVRLVEERELLQRFPDYAEYRRRVPAFAPHPRDVSRLWKLLVLG